VEKKNDMGSKRGWGVRRDGLSDAPKEAKKVSGGAKGTLSLRSLRRGGKDQRGGRITDARWKNPKNAGALREIEEANRE